MSNEEGTYETWFWSTMERKWVKNFWSFWGDNFETELQNDVIDAALDGNSTDSIKWITHPVEGATIYFGEGVFEDEDYDTGRLFDHQFKIVLIINKDLPARKFITLRKMVQNLVKASTFKPKR
jgi:hypothetical protein